MLGGGTTTQDQTTPPEERQANARRLADLITGYQTSVAIGALARLGVPDALASGPRHAADLAEQAGADESALIRLFEATAEIGLVSTTEDGRYALTSLGELLRGDVEGSLRRLAIVSTDEWRWRAYGHLTHAVRTGEPGFVPAHGCRFWQYLASHPAEAASFNESMRRISAARDAALATSYDFSRLHRLVDIGGGNGSSLRALLASYPLLRGVLFDRSSVVEGAKEQLLEAGLAERCEVVAGDFFDAVPAGGDTYLLSWILHDWDDESALRILKNCRDAMDENGRLLVVELVVPAVDEPGGAAVSKLIRQTDLEMLTVVGGRERTVMEFDRLFGRAGLCMTRVVPLTGVPWSVVEAQAAPA